MDYEYYRKKEEERVTDNEREFAISHLADIYPNGVIYPTASNARYMHIKCLRYAQLLRLFCTA